MTRASPDSVPAGRVGFLVCRVGPHSVALPLAGVVGVTEAAPVTPLPFVPASVDGLVLAMGHAVVQVTLATVLGLEAGEAGVLVVTSVEDDMRALKVSSVLAMVEVDAEAIGPPPVQGAGVHALGAFAWNGSEVAVLDTARLWSAEILPAAMGQPSGAALLALAAPPRAPERDGAATAARDAFLVVEAGGEVYALRSEEVRELLVVESTRPMPGAPAWLAGLLDRRGTPTLAIDTRRLLGHSDLRPGRLALLVAGGGLGPLALLVEHALGIRYVERDHVHPVSERTAGVESYFVSEGRIIGIIGTGPLLAQVSAPLAAFTPRAPEPAPSRVAEPSRATARQALTVRVGENRFAIALERVERILAGVAIAPLPGDGNGFSGLADVGEVPVPVLDLRLRLEREGALHPRPPCALVRLEGAVAGLIVDQVLRIETLEQDTIDPVAPDERMPVSGVVELDGRMVALLMIDRLLPVLP